MPQTFRHKTVRMLAERETLNGPKLCDQIHDHILEGGLSFTPLTAPEHQKGVELLADLMHIHQSFVDEAGPFEDMFGEYLEESNQLHDATGQFFTPMSVVKVMVPMTLPSDVAELDAKPLYINDPACGTGRFMLGIAEHYAKALGYFNFLIVNVDIDRRAWIYCTTNALLNQIPSINIWGNTLSLETYAGFAVTPDLTWPWQRVEKKKAREILERGLGYVRKPSGPEAIMAAPGSANPKKAGRKLKTQTLDCFAEAS